MGRRSIAVVALACLVLLAGCSSMLAEQDQTPDGGSAPAFTGTDEETTTPPSATGTTDTSTPPMQTDTSTSPNQTDTSTSPMQTDTETDASTPTRTATSTPDSWSTPEEPNGPLQHSLNGSQGNRISTVEQTEHDTSWGGVVLSATANTSMASVDPPEHGTVRGEPYFLVYVDGQFEDAGQWAGSNFSTVNGTLVERVDPVSQRDNGTFELGVSPAAFEAADAEAGDVDLLVLLMDEDKQWDDVFGVQRITVEYAPEE